MTLAAGAIRAMGSSVELPRTLFNYEVLGFIGEGAGSLIYAVADPDTHQIFAMKHVRRRSERDVRFFEQLENEYEVARHFDKGPLRRCYDYQDNRTLLKKATEAVLVMEMFDGAPLEVRKPEGILSLIDLFIQITAAMAELHVLGFVHCDLKPNNILLGHDGDLKIIDFGQTCRIGAVKKRIQGTPDYIAPEQVKCLPVTARTDVFNLGATMYWALAGRNIPTLFTINKGDNSFLVDAAIPSPRDIVAGVPEPLSNLVMECIRSNPQKRPEDMNELRRRLEIIRYAVCRQGMAVA